MQISNIECENVASRFACIIAGIPGHDIEDVSLHNIRILYPGDEYERDATTRPAEMEKIYPEPTMFHAMPAYGFFIRHVAGIDVEDLKLSTEIPDPRPAFWLESVSDADFFNIRAPHAAGVATFHLEDVKGFTIRSSLEIPDIRREQVDEDQF